MNIVLRTLERILIFLISIAVLWFIATQIFDRLDEQFSIFSALMITYVLSAYIILPRVIHISALVLRKGRIPRFTRAGDGLPADPVNIILHGSRNDLINAFKKAGWYEADKLTPKTAFLMTKAFIRNTPYLSAPFSPLFLFDRPQDIGFQMAIGNSPRQRHHVRFWATNIDTVEDPLDIRYWKKKQTIDYSEPVMWIGAGTKDVGFGFAKLTYQISHAVDPDVDSERDFILSSLKNVGATSEVSFYDSGTYKVGKYASDGKIAEAKLRQ